MDIRNDEKNEFFDVSSPYLIGGVSLLTILTIYVGYFVSIRYGILSSTLILCYIGIYTTNTWHNEFVKDGYAPISNLYSGYLSALFLFFGLTPVLYLIIGGIASFLTGLFVAILYSSVISAVAFRDIGQDKRKHVIKTYKGPSVVYKTDGPYIKHTEEVALSDREPLDN